KISPNDLIRRGQKIARVKLEFKHEDSIYSLRRTRSIKGKGMETVNLTKNGKIILDEERKKKADQWIEDNLITYSDFKNTTLILQDEMKSVLEMERSKRKNYLERMFGIKEYNDMAEVSRDHGNSLDVKISEKKGEIIALEGQLVDEDELTKQEEHLVKELQIVTKEFNIAEEIYDKSDLEYQEIRNFKVEFENLIKEISQTKSEEMEIQDEIDGLTTSIQENKERLQSKSDWEDQQKQIQKLEIRLDDLKQVEIKLANRRDQKSRILKLIQLEENSLKQQLSNYQSSINDHQSVLNDLTLQINELELKRETIADLEKEIESFEKVRMRLTKLQKTEKQQIELDKSLSIAKNGLEIQIKNYLTDIEKKGDRIKQLPDVEERLSEKDGLEVVNADLVEEMNVLKANLTQLQEEVNVATKAKRLTTYEITSISEKIIKQDTEIAAVKNLDLSANCPRCKQPLTKIHLKKMVSTLRAELKILKLGLKDKKTDLGSLTETEGIVLDKLTTCQKAIESKIEARRHNEKLIVELSKFTQKKIELDLLNVEIKQFHSDGGEDALFPEVRKKLATIELTIKKLNFKQSKLDSLNSSFLTLSGKKAMFIEINKALARLPKLKSNNTKAKQKILGYENEKQVVEIKLQTREYLKEEQQELISLSHLIADLGGQIVEIPIICQKVEDLDPKTINHQLTVLNQLADDNKELKTILKENEKSKNKKIRKLTKLSILKDESKYAKLNEKEQLIQIKLAEAKKKLDEKNTEKINKARDLQELNSKQAVQQQLSAQIADLKVIVGSKLETQDLYNLLEMLFKRIGGRILSRLRDYINIETHRILKYLGNSELEGILLDENYNLQIRTPHGTERPGYFSGGQKIRIAFAFRLALSQVLADFRGNDLQTLIIDEGGFGALDKEGQEGVVDVFHALQDKFHRMIVISHIPRIADNLPGTQILIDNGRIVEN
ncbi:MAG: SMC family ATPase, partial [Candidatus Heimdallarchaeota archaeon]|nr:SMC family ATPase [Candidatus Heimdallarchaeota archaeon]